MRNKEVIDMLSSSKSQRTAKANVEFLQSILIDDMIHVGEFTEDEFREIGQAISDSLSKIESVGVSPAIPIVERFVSEFAKTMMKLQDEVMKIQREKSSDNSDMLDDANSLIKKRKKKE